MWDYKVVWLEPSEPPDDEKLTSQLHKLGDDGWELVAIMPRGFGTQQAFFKRRRPA